MINVSMSNGGDIQGGVRNSKENARHFWLMPATLCLAASFAWGQAPLEPSAPVTARVYHVLRTEEDWSFLADPTARVEWLDRIKYIPWRSGGNSQYLSIGGEYRQTVESVRNDAWNPAEPAWNRFGLERFQLHFDVHADRRLRLFLQLESGLEQGRKNGPRVIDGKRLDFLNAFADLGLNGAAHSIVLRVGRQEIQLGSGRMVAVREGPNVRQSFYGARLSAPLGLWRSEWFALRPAADKPGFFDNVPLQTTSFWGAFATRPWNAGSLNLLDVYYYGLDRKQAVFNRGTGREQRHTIGARIASHDPASTAGRMAILHFDAEAAAQFGSFAGSGIQAWTAASEFGVILPELPFTPRLGLRTNVSSGDGGSKQNLGTFNPLFPIGNYFGILADTGPGPLNARDLHPNLRLTLPHGVALDADWLFWWRQSLQDGVYGVPGNLLVSAGKSNARFVGHRPGMEARWQIDRHAYLQLDYGVFFAGGFPRQSGRTSNLNYGSLWLGYKF
jgi:hypothetical protein